MTRAKFAELASAYIDGELSESETKLLMEEIRNNPERRMLLACYKRMNRAVARAKFPQSSVAAPQKGSAGSAFAWSLSGAAVGILMVLVLTTLFKAPVPKATDDEGAATCVIAGDLAVKSNSKKPCFIIDATDIRRAVPKPFASGFRVIPAQGPFVKDAADGIPYVSMAAERTALEHCDIPEQAKIQTGLQQGVGAIFMPVSFRTR